MTVCDSHTHIFPVKVAEKATHSIGEFYGIPMCETGTAERLIKDGSAAGISRFLVCSVATRPGQIESINNYISSECALHPEFIGLSAMHKYLRDFDAELDRALSLGLRGVKFHNDMQHYDIDAPDALPLYRAIAKRGMPVLFHMGDDRYDHTAPLRLVRLLDKVPELTCIASHFGGYRRWDDAEKYLVGADVYFDTASSLPYLAPGRAERMISLFGAGRFMFGTDFPMWEPAVELARFLALSLTNAEREAVLHENFERLFKL